MNNRLPARAATAAATLFVASLAMLVLGVGRGDRATLEDAATSRPPVTTQPATSAVVNEPDPLAVPAPVPAPGASGALDPTSETSTGTPAAAATPAKEAAAATASPASPAVRASGGNDGKSSATARPAKHKTGRSVEGTDNGGSFTYAEDGKNTRASSMAAADDDPLMFVAYVGADEDGTANIRMQITNHNGDRIGFPDGLRVTLTLVHKESGHRRTVTLEAPEITGLNDGGSVDIVGSAGLDRYGTYEYAASTLVDFGA